MDLDELTHLVSDGSYDSVYPLFKNTRETCPWCFDRVRRLYPEHDAARIRSIHAGESSAEPGVLEAAGITKQEDGTLQVDSATSDADPATVKSVVPPTRLPAPDWHPAETRYVAPRQQYVCATCGIVDHDFTRARSWTWLLFAVGNIADRLHDEYLLFDELAAQQIVHKAKQRPELTCEDDKILRNAVLFGLRQAYGGPGRSRTADRPTPDPDDSPRARGTSPTNIAQFGD
jgi:hypothetical protein